VTPDVYARLTDAQIEEIYAHPRDDNGRLIAPARAARPLTLGEDLAAAESMMRAFGVPASEQEKAYQKIREAHQGRARR